MDTIDELFDDANVVATHEVAAAFDISETEARDWAADIGVAKIGASFAWSRPDVVELAARLDDEADANDETPDGEDEDPEDEEDPDSEEPDEDE